MNTELNITTITTTPYPETHDVNANICYEWENLQIPAISSSLNIRVKGNTFWHKVSVPLPTASNGNNCYDIPELIPSTTYEVQLAIIASDGDFNSSITEFTTLDMSAIENSTCDTLQYLVALLCQAVVALQDGDMDVYANDCSKELCDPLSMSPTMLTLWSRALRLFHAVKCVACDMSTQSIGGGKEGQYLVGERGWVDMIKEVVENTDPDSWKLVPSDTVAKYIDDKLHEVWHYQGKVDYIVDNLTNIPDDATSIINLADDKIYTKSGSDWVVSTTIPQPENFGGYNINNESITTTLGTVKAGSIYYYFEGTWNLLNADIDWMLEIVNDIWENRGNIVETPTTDQPITTYFIDKDVFNCNMLPNGKRSIAYITEPIDTTTDTMYKVNFAGMGATSTPASQMVQSGGLAQKPADPTRYGYLFSGWQLNGSNYDFTMPVTADITLAATWATSPSAIGYSNNPNNEITLTYSWDSGNETLTITTASAGNRKVELDVGSTPNSSDLGHRTSNNGQIELYLSNLPHGGNKYIYIQAKSYLDNGVQDTAWSVYRTIIGKNPVIGCIIPKCGSTEPKLNIVDIIEKKLDGTCTPRWQTGTRVFHKNQCGVSSYLLQESGDYLLQEDSSNIALED